MVVNTTPNDISNQYFGWLCEQVRVGEEYWIMMQDLYDYEYRYFVRNDDNRFNDGLTLRDRFLDERGLKGIIFGPCSVLEMMVALAKRMEDDIMYDPELGDRTSEWFWTMIRNLGLDRYSDDQLDGNMHNEIRRILDVFVNREYAMNGTGGLFPLRHPEHNQRRVEVWYQMHNYIRENYVI